MSMLDDFIYTRTQFISHIAAPNLIRLENFVWQSNGTLRSRKGFEPIAYYIGSTSSSPLGTSGDQCLLRMERGGNGAPYLYSSNEYLFLGDIATDNLKLFGDSLFYFLPNGSGFGVVPFSLKPDGTSSDYRYYAVDATTQSSFVEGSYKTCALNYQGKVVFASGNGSWQVIQNGIGTASSNFTRLDNTILPAPNQTIIGLADFENRILAITEEGNLLYSPVNWEGTTAWRSDDANLGGVIPIIKESGESLETLTVGRSGVVISSRNTARVSGNIYNITTLDLSQLIVRRTGQNAFFSRGALVSLDDSVYGLSPQGLLNVGIDSLTLTAVAKNESSAISEYMIELFKDDTVYNVLDSFLDTKSKTAYYIVGVRHTNNVLEGETVILSYQFDLKKWSKLTTKLPIQRMFMYYGSPAAAGYIVNPVTNEIFLGIWSLSEIYKDFFVDIELSGGNYYWDYSTTSTPYKKYMVTGNLNMSGGKTGGNGDGRGQDNVLNFATNTNISYTAGLFTYSAFGLASTQLLTNSGDELVSFEQEECWADIGFGGKWGYSLKDKFKLNQKAYCFKRGTNLLHQAFFSSESDADIIILDLSMDNTNISP